MGDTAKGSWGSRELGAYIRREEARADAAATPHSHICPKCHQPWTHNCGNPCTWPTVCVCGRCEYEMSER